MTKSFGIHWFRRDLRVAGNLALRENFKRHQGRVVGLFCFDSEFLSRPDFSSVRFAFFLKTLRALKEELRLMGSDLLVLDRLPRQAFADVVCRWGHEGAKPSNLETHQLRTVSWSRDYEPFARKRDQEIEDLLRSAAIEVVTSRDHLLIEPHELKKADGSGFFQLYTPFSRRWMDLVKSPPIQSRLEACDLGIRYFERSESEKQKVANLTWSELANQDPQWRDSCAEFESLNSKRVSIPIPEAGSAVAFIKLRAFSESIEEYEGLRDFPAVSGTSGLSLFFKNGSMTVPLVIKYLNLADPRTKQKSGAEKFLKELIWREFYYHILYHRPEVEKESFLPQFKSLKWQNNSEWFERWCAGQTGFPIVDAGMRQLLQTGHMHNRVRMIVASFLVKDLLIDWRWGENHFMKLLLDGDLAPNNGGWQWAASTGCDPQPYFRIFNPWLQGEKFDPDGEYIKAHVLELRDSEPKSLHAPEASRPALYPRPMVDHRSQKMKALALYQGASAKGIKS